MSQKDIVLIDARGSCLKAPAFVLPNATLREISRSLGMLDERWSLFIADKFIPRSDYDKSISEFEDEHLEDGWFKSIKFTYLGMARR